MPIRIKFDKDAYLKRHREFREKLDEFKSGDYEEAYNQAQVILESSVLKPNDAVAE
ncbi:MULTISPECIES: hypothetical protein [Bacillus]|uniref:hypothetical protein n=1 Tax=Bacillus TaxID=1386 RepID=UPI0012FD2C79|nr:MULTISPECIES: hypothetical protein [Bacillus amyloliquefaciens group]MCB5334787.1 hypothetical protein [Bacillus amyloliquefaciens]MDE5154187.1 hypothetical protein [Bacillus amyloliquefaciens]QTG83517.1 hypothetical protein J4048_11085 [Bacillus amyloliquefaciens]QZE16325.1 hypothetical protein K4L72_11090 [Bacillus velezensis]UBZ23498.1 hypothetical protein JS608_02639 [Bacillus amyloliquefaciens]